MITECQECPTGLTLCYIQGHRWALCRLCHGRDISWAQSSPRRMHGPSSTELTQRKHETWPYCSRVDPSAHAHQGSPGLTAPHFPTLLIYSANVQCPPGLHSWTLFTKWGLSDPCPDSTLEQLLGTVVCRCPSLVGAELLQILQQESAPTQANTFLLVWRSLTII